MNSFSINASRNRLGSGVALSALVVGTLMSACQPAEAASATIVNGQTVGQQVLAPGDTLTVELGGGISDTASGVLDSAVGTVTVNNDGNIVSTLGHGIEGHFSHFVIANTGYIAGAGAGIYQDSTSDITSLINSGTISGVGAAGVISGGDIGLLNNSSYISGFSDGVVAAGTIHDMTNSGSVIAVNGTGLKADSITKLDNSGTIGAAQDGVAANSAQTITNTGLIVGDVDGVNIAGTLGSLANSGYISGAGYAGVLATDIGTLTNTGTGLIDGQDGLYVSGTLGSLENSATINGTSIGIHGGTLANVTNTGTINGQIIAIEVSNIGSLTNSGTISGHASGAIRAGATITYIDNSGTITDDNSAAIYADVLTGLVNSGRIEGVLEGIYVANTISSLVNSQSGSIIGNVGSAIFSATLSDLDNSGLIYSDARSGIEVGTLTHLDNSGTISAPERNGVEAVTILSMENSGLIGGKFSGVIATGSIGSLENTGLIYSQGAAVAAASIASLSNLGLGLEILKNNNGNGLNDAKGLIFGKTAGVSTDGNLDSLINSGIIIGQDMEGVQVGLTLAYLDNSGGIIGGLHGILANAIGEIDNSEAIYGGDIGIESTTSIASITNTGDILGYNTAITADTIGYIRNTGTIGSDDATGTAIFEASAFDTTLDLGAGSVLIGHVDISQGNDTLRIGHGLNLALTFDGSAPETITAEGQPYVVVGNTVYSADTGAIGAIGQAVDDMSGAIAASYLGALGKGYDEKGEAGAPRFWMSGLTGGGSTAASFDQRFAGVTAGADFGPDLGTRTGFFIGYAQVKIEGGGSDLPFDSIFGGLYASRQYQDLTVHAGITAGTANSGGATRIIADNTVDTGLRSVDGEQNAAFVSLGAEFIKPWVGDNYSFESVFGLRYTGVFAGDYSEGDPMGISFEGGSSHIFAASLLSRKPFQQVTDSGVLTGNLHAGLEAQAVNASAVDGSLGGIDVSFAGQENAPTLGLLAGAATEFRFAKGSSLYGSFDAVARTDSSANWRANAGFKLTF